jgi:hypothetical protein
VAAVGLGGILTEALGPVTLGLAPLTPAEGAAMLAASRVAPLLRGGRGTVAADTARLGALVAGIGDLLDAHPEIVELDVNPVIVRGEQAVAVDALVIVGPRDAKEETHA